MTERTKTSPHHVRRTLLKNKTLNIESVGKHDMATLSDVADSPQGDATILRLIMGARRAMPARALSYIDTALRIAEVLPCEQLQIVHVNTLGEMVNGIDASQSREMSTRLAVLARLHAQAFFPGLVEKVLHAEDTPFDLAAFQRASEVVFTSQPAIAEPLLGKGTKHGGDAVTYASAHSAFQDTDRLELRSLIPDMPDQASAERIVSIGCQQERVFYATRMAMRPLLLTEGLLDTAQLFTGHHTPPYFVARGGEQLMDDMIANGLDLAQFTDRSARRDIEQFRTNLGGTTNG